MLSATKASTPAVALKPAPTVSSSTSKAPAPAAHAPVIAKGTPAVSAVQTTPVKAAPAATSTAKVATPATAAKVAAPATAAKAPTATASAAKGPTPKQGDKAVDAAAKAFAALVPAEVKETLVAGPAEGESAAEKLAALEALPAVVDAESADAEVAKSRLHHARSIRTCGDLLNPINAPDQDGKTSVCRAAYAGNATELSSLLEKGASIHLPDRGGMTPLIWACNKGRIECVKILLAAGADTCTLDSHGRNAWWYADMREFADIKATIEAAGGRAPPPKT